MSNYYFVTIDKFFIGDSENALSELSRKNEHQEAKHSKGPKEIYDEIAKYNNPLYAGTITLDPKKCLNLNYYEKKARIQTALRALATKKNFKFVAILEDTTSMVPHAHLLCAGYQRLFVNVVGHLGQHNKKNESYQEIKSIEKYKEYMFKDYKQGDMYYYST